MAVTKICKVLVVEDNQDIQDLLGEAFGHEGYHFTLVSNGAAMRQALAAGDVDIVLIDVLLPGGENGIALAEEAAAHGCGVILVTGHHDHFETVEKSGHRYLFKPYRIAPLLELVDQVLRESKARCTAKGRSYGGAAR